MSAKVQGWVWDLDLPAQPKLILLWLANRATDAGVCFPSKRELGERTGLSERMVRYHLAALASDHDDQGQGQEPVLRIVERRVACDRNTSNVYVIRVPWASQDVVRGELQELRHVPSEAIGGVGATGGTQGGGDALHPVGAVGSPQVGDTGCTQTRSPETYHRKQFPLPPTGEQPQQRDWASTETATGAETPREEPVGQNAETLAAAFYAALGADTLAVTGAMRRRDLAIARQLVDAGATAAEAAAYARDTSAVSGRMAPVDLRSFERERLGWLARRRGKDLSERRVVDRTGQPPSWQTQPTDSSLPPGGPVPAQQPQRATDAGASGTSGLAGNQLADKLRTLFTGAGQ